MLKKTESKKLLSDNYVSTVSVYINYHSNELKKLSSSTKVLKQFRYSSYLWKFSIKLIPRGTANLFKMSLEFNK